mmetsp:Transcript_14183/g.17570  ORF Transcript_14183/g.17570 Transcript_14183/m.17570 type:complete len:199 (-) Transcript_14183:470-1066(-)
MYSFSSLIDLVEEEELYRLDRLNDIEDVRQQQQQQEENNENGNIILEKKEKVRERKSSFTDSVKNLLFPTNLLANIGATSEALAKLPKLAFGSIHTMHAEEGDEEDREVARHFDKERKLETDERYGFEVSIGTPPILLMHADDEQVRFVKGEKERKFQDQLAEVRAKAKFKYVKEMHRRLEKERETWHWTGGHSVHFG